MIVIKIIGDQKIIDKCKQDNSNTEDSKKTNNFDAKDLRKECEFSGYETETEQRGR